MSSTNGIRPNVAEEWHGLVRSPENGGRKSRTLRDTDDLQKDATVQVQAKVAKMVQPDGTDRGRMLQIRYWTEEGHWGHIVIDPNLPGVSGVVAIGYGEREKDSWAMARQAAFDGYNVEL